MLEEQDLQAIAKLITDSEARTVQKIAESEARTFQRFDEIDKRLADFDKHFEAVDKRLDAFDKRFEAVGKRLDAFDKRFEAADKHFIKIDRRLDTLDKRISSTENLLVDEIGCVYKNLNNQISEIRKRVDDIDQYYRIRKLEDDNTALLFSITEEHDKRIRSLEARHYTAV